MGGRGDEGGVRGGRCDMAEVQFSAAALPSNDNQQHSDK